MWSEPWFTVQFVYWFSLLREEVCSRTPAAQPWIYVSIEWQAVLYWAARPLTLLMALISERILCLSVSLSYKLTHKHSQLGSLQLVPMVIIISCLPSVYLWTVQAHMAMAVCKWLYIHVHAYKHRDRLALCPPSRPHAAFQPSLLYTVYIGLLCMSDTRHSAHHCPHILTGAQPRNSFIKCNYNRPHTDQCFDQTL